MCVSRNPNHEVSVKRRCIFEPALARDPYGLLLGLVEISAMLYQFGTEGLHRRIFFGRVAVRHDDGHGNTGARSSVGKRLTVVAARSRNYPGSGSPFAFEPLKVDKS